MDMFVSVGIRAYSPEKKRRLVAAAREHLPDPAVYDGHRYTNCFTFDGEHIVMTKESDNSVELTLTCDSSTTLFNI
jgi:hypothetical protein